MGFVVLMVLKDRPEDAGWLTNNEKEWLNGELERDRKEGGAADTHHLADAFKHPMVWLLALLFALEQLGVYTVNIWMPDLLSGVMADGSGAGAAAAKSSFIALLSTIPYFVAALCTVAVGWNSDRLFERKWHISACFVAAAAGFGWAAYAHTLTAMMLAMTLGAVGYWSLTGPFWALPTRVLGGQAAAGGVAIITMIGSLGAFAGPSLTGKLRDVTHNYTAGLLVIGGLALLGAVLCGFLSNGKDAAESPSA